ncbi:similar to Saccharomyces cerevisiae YNL129W NRK1 Nicotinamide riboside kinase [Maudiozyma saulgeensis]|uniref:Similar to Saccharomyces cerevisiae YNL129W NRK1 Nicotinamide riboside kinase n=1 Tax=Maudiozyma saulgeensis TaxID=1789683 RepID=A0A1X7QY65_9SACH|nr:similar to Saccharomyces cerevisiae YNL129W NRK1 Nicotinamide riboside kinase [Kazachstania saulgeensis]
MTNNNLTKKIILIGLSGCSSTGKTTLAKLASKYLPNAVLIHEDDFYKHDEEVPLNTKYNIRDWDSPEALDLALFKKELNTIKNTGQIATKLIHNNNVDDISKHTLSDQFLKELVNKTQYIDKKYKLVIVDGFMLYNNHDISSEFDLRLFIRAPYKTLKKRRDARNGYQTLDSFWVDPPYYFDEFVYKSYEENHRSLFQHGDVEGKLTTESSKEIKDFNNDDGVSIEESLSWVIDQIVFYCKD